MHTATIEEVQAKLPELLERLASNDEVVITSNGRPVGRILPPSLQKGVPILGRGIGKLISYVDDDEHLEDFKDCMP